MVSYPLNLFQDQTYTIIETNGEAAKLFGDPKRLPAGQKLTIKFEIRLGYVVKFTLTNAKPDPGRDFAVEAQARMITADNPTMTHWPSREGFIMGFIKKDVPKEKQLFMMWLERVGQLADPNAPLKLMMFFFHNEDCFSGGTGDINGIAGGMGQDNGGGVGTGPNYRP